MLGRSFGFLVPNFVFQIHACINLNVVLNKITKLVLAYSLNVQSISFKIN